MTASVRRDLAVVAIFTALVFIPFMGKAYHIDEPFFIVIARQIARAPLHPLAFLYNWEGQTLPMAQNNNTPPLMLYLLGGAFKITGGAEWPMRLLFFPFDLMAAAALYLIAARFLKKPLLPVLIAIASPAYLINMNHLMPEKLIAAFGFSGLCALMRGVDERRPRWFWASALLMAAAVMSKYNAIIFLPPAAAYALARGVKPRRVALFVIGAMLPVAAYLAYDFLAHGVVFDTAWKVTRWGANSWWSLWSHKTRSFLSHIGGCGIVTVFWPLWLCRKNPVLIALSAAAAVLLFSPAHDVLRSVWAGDRLLGIFFSAGAVLSLLALLLQKTSREMPGWVLWLSWILAVGFIEVVVYGRVLTRFTVFLIPPFIFSMAEILESERAALRAVYGASLAAVLALSVPLAVVDFRYARAQKFFARDVARPYLASGKRLWFTGHWGLQYYIEREGALAIDSWDQVRPGDRVLISRVNANTALFDFFKVPFSSNVKTWRVDSAIALRLISDWGGMTITTTNQAGFYNSAWGFLPYSFSREPLDEFVVCERL